MEQRGMQGMWGRYALFVVLALAILMINMFINPPKPQPQREAKKPAAAPEIQPAEGEQEAAAKPAEETPPEETPAEQPAAAQAPDQPAEEPAAIEPPEISPDWVTLGSADPADPFRMLVTLSNEGASVVRVEMNSPRYRDQEDRSGYLGHIVGDEFAGGDGCPVQMVGEGTPAAQAGLEKGDLITAMDGKRVLGSWILKGLLKETKPGQTVQLTVTRDSKELKLPVTLGWQPMAVIRPEGSDPLSFLLTLAQVDDLKLDDAVEAVREKRKAEGEEQKSDGVKERPPEFGMELDGLDLRGGTWEIVRHSRTEAVFRRLLPKWNLEVLKTYQLDEVPAKSQADSDYKAYHLTLGVEIRNADQKSHKVAYQLDGPNGLPIEGYWYANKIGRRWGAVGLRDVVVSFDGATEPDMISCQKIAKDDMDPPWQDESLTYIGVDAQYFSAVMMPLKENPQDIWFATSQPIRVGPVAPEWTNKTNTSFRVSSLAADLEPGQSQSHSFLVFAGPKRPELLDDYNLEGLVYYGWFGVVAKPMLGLLHFFYAIVRNYGIAIIMLTVLVRSLMFPMSRKQALNAQKMAELQPEIKKIHEKYKKDFDARNKAQQELFRKHNYNPLSGCLVLFLQLPIFLGLYRGLMVDIELRQAPLISEAVRWCSNLAAPDMLFDWSGFMPTFVTAGRSMFALGPYFNLLPVLTIVLFIMQQKMFMPPPADEQAAMQQKIMKFMMVFMGIVFFKVASGLCIYFIASSAWGLAERKFLPKSKPPQSGDTPPKPDNKLMSRFFSAAPGREPNGGRRKKSGRGKR
jgi:YidC/Oxa1 family membrane protein insertase